MHKSKRFENIQMFYILLALIFVIVENSKVQKIVQLCGSILLASRKPTSHGRWYAADGFIATIYIDDKHYKW